MAALNDELTTLIRTGADQQQLGSCLRRQGIRSLMEDGLEKVAAGVTSLDELMRVCGRRRLEPLCPDAAPALEEIVTQ